MHKNSNIGNGDGPQHDFVLFDGLVSENGVNEIMLLCYDGRQTTGSSADLEGLWIEVREWRIKGWSGNVDDENGDPYILRRVLG